MKQIILPLLLAAFSTKSFAQETNYSITIDTFEDQRFEYFSPGKKNRITTDIVTKGTFLIYVDALIKIDSLKIVNAENQDVLYPPDPKSKLTCCNTYTINSVYKNPDNQVVIKLFRGKIEKTILLMVEPDGSTTTQGQKQENCTSLLKNCGSIEHVEFFGEDVHLYGKKTVVYVYDFNTNPSQRVFYKITRIKNPNLDSLQHDLKSKERALNSARSATPLNNTALQQAQAAYNNAFTFLETNRFMLQKELVNLNREKITSNQHVRFKVFNINRFMYHVSIADTVIQYDSEPSILLKKYFLGDNTTLEGISALYSEVKATKNSTIDLETLEEKLSCFYKHYNELQNQIVKAYDPCETFSCCQSIDYTELADSKDEIRLELMKIKRDLKQQERLIPVCAKAKADKIKLEADIKQIKKDIDKLKGTAQQKKNDELKEKANQLNQLRENSKDCSNRDSTTAKAEVQAGLAEIDELSTLINQLPSNKELRQIIIFINNMVLQNNMHTSDYISTDGNLLELTINITSKDSMYQLFSIPEYKNQMDIQIPIIGKPFVSFSSGSFLAPGKNLRNDTYSWQETVNAGNNTADTNFQLVNSGSTLAPLGLCALGNVEWKFTRNLGAGLSAGVGMTIEKNPRLAYLGGISFFFGNMRQFALTGGVTAMQVNKLASNFQTTVDNQVIYHAKTDINYYQELKFGGFVSLTYTPFKAYKPKREKQSKE